MTDRYTQEIERVFAMLAKPGRPGLVLAFGYGREHSPLFSAIAKDRTNSKCGCPILIRQGDNKDSESFELTQAIQQDERLPKSYIDITADCLPALAEWQRKADQELGRKAPPLLKQ